MGSVEKVREKEKPTPTARFWPGVCGWLSAVAQVGNLGAGQAGVGRGRLESPSGHVSFGVTDSHLNGNGVPVQKLVESSGLGQGDVRVWSF